METFVRVTGPAAALGIDNLNTDTIMPSQMSLVPSGGGLTYRPEDYAANLLAPLRYDENGTERADFVLNREPFRQGCPILIGGANFGCGSHRNTALWGIVHFGIRCIIAPSFGPTFYTSCFKNGVLPIVIEENISNKIAAAAKFGSDVTVDLEARRIDCADGASYAFSIPAFRREALLRGLDRIAMTIAREAEIATWQVWDRDHRPWIYTEIKGH